MAVSITVAAAKRIKHLLASRGQGLGLRIAVKESGCSGYMYDIGYADELTDNDRLFESHDAKVIIDTQSLTFLDGTEIDYGQEGLNETFKFNNPNTTAQCGCGESFVV